MGLDTRIAHPARVYDYWLGGKDNISQVVPAVSHSGRTLVIQACQAHYSKIASPAVRNLCDTSLGGNVRFSGRAFLTLA
ncbi:MAG: SAM-dependent methyltransferase [Streptosporangiaceae bacterium]